MAIESLVALNVVDENAYQSYRDEIMPILKTYGGGFGYDFQVAKVLTSTTEAPINRVFTIYFASEDSMNAFFSNAEYLAVKQKHFVNAVTDTTIIATYHR